jgi:phosphopantothenoylcysteine decarboxylase/phosphopantothenoylcysteine decarboxylase/phosphopantothenate--cysteine ligase
MTRSAQKLITAITFQTLTKNKVYTELFDEIIYEDVRHISLAQNADLALIAPATANIIGKIAGGIADDMLSTVIMAIRDKPVLICPAMNTAMYENPIVAANIEKLAGLGYRFIEPREGRLACGDTGKGALAPVEFIVEEVRRLLGTSI